MNVYGLKGVQQAEVKDEFTKYIDKPVDPQKIESTIADLEGTGIYSSISYNLIDEKDQTGSAGAAASQKLWTAVFECGVDAFVE